MAADVPDAQGSSSNVAGSFSLVEIGALIVVGVFVLFELIAGEYFVSGTSTVLAIAILALPRLAPASLDAIASRSAMMQVAGYLLAFSGAVELLDDLRFDALDGGAAIIGGLVAYAGYGLAFVGARSIDS